MIGFVSTPPPEDWNDDEVTAREAARRRGLVITVRPCYIELSAPAGQVFVPAYEPRLLSTQWALIAQWAETADVQRA